MLHGELWDTIAKPILKAVTVPWDPDQPDLFPPDLFPVFRQVSPFLCFACIERRLGRQLTKEDLTPCLFNQKWME
jgi:hypothetical protein